MRDGLAPTRAQALALSGCDDIAAMMTTAALLRDRGHGANVSYSRKVFIPLTQLCRDVCHYCTFAQPPRGGRAPTSRPTRCWRSPGPARAAGCKEALFTLGDKPELRYRAAREALAAARLRHDAGLPRRHGGAGTQGDRSPAAPQPGRHDRDDFAAPAPGLGVAGDHAGDRRGAAVRSREARISARPTSCRRRLATIAAAGEAAVPFTSGILIGIGETRARAPRGAPGPARPA